MPATLLEGHLMTTTILVGTAKGLFVFESADGHSWKSSGPFLGGWEVSSTLRKGNRWYVGTTHYAYGATIRVSDDQGANWTQLANQPTFRPETGWKVNRIWELVGDSKSDRIYAGIDEAAIFYSDDQGNNWTEMSGLTAGRKDWCPGAGGLCLHSIIPHPTDKNRVWVGISAVGAFRTDDGGKSWKNLNKTLPILPTGSPDESTACCVHRIAIDPNNSDSLYMQYHGGVLKSDDAGDNWVRIENGLPSNFGFPMVMTRSGRLLVIPLVADSERYVAGGKLRVYASEDKGNTWADSSKNIPADPRFSGVLRCAMASDPNSSVVAFGTTNGEVLVSPDSGRNWKLLPVQLPRVLHVSIAN